MEKNLIYADNAATTQIDEAALKVMTSYLEEYGNPSSLYSIGQSSKKAIKIARHKIATCIGADDDEIYFTSCGTESDNWALKGTAFAYIDKGNHIVTSAIEHHAILNSCKSLERKGLKVTYLPVTSAGIITGDILKKACTDKTTLVSIMMANNEIGTIQDIKELCEIAHGHGILFHTDAVQSVGHIPIDVHELGIDMLSASAHKFNGPKGIGFLYKRKGVQMEPLIDGGGQESGLRAGTENVASILGMAAALEGNIELLQSNIAHIKKLERYTMTGLKSFIPEIRINGSTDNRIPGNVSVSLPGITAEGMLHILDLKGICVSSGSACNSAETIVSHVIKAINVPEEYAKGTLRITYGKNNTMDEAKTIVDTIKNIYQKSRQ